MKFKWIATMTLVMLGASSYVLFADAETHQREMVTSATQGDGRQLVQFPEAMRLHTIANMRDHLLALQEIDVALSRSDFDQAAKVAEERLGRVHSKYMARLTSRLSCRKVCKLSARRCIERQADLRSRRRTRV